MKGRAEKRHRTKAKVQRAVKILRLHAWNTDNPTLLAKRAKRFADSHWGCNCCLCMNPRRLYKGKNAASLTRSERNHTNEE